MSSDASKSLSLKQWSEEDRPREKLLEKGKSALSDAELLAILIGSGSKNETAVDLCKRILNSINNDLNKLARLTVGDLMRFKGIGEAKAITIVAAIELSRRRKDNEQEDIKKITSSQSAWQLLKPRLFDLAHEEFHVILLARNNSVIKIEQISKGGIAGTVVDIKMLFKAAIDWQASAMICAHNHPSGNVNPSEADKTLTTQIKGAAKLFEISLLDHIIFTNNAYFSFADEGIL
jgi:DNA repair protein RadC